MMEKKPDISHTDLEAYKTIAKDFEKSVQFFCAEMAIEVKPLEAFS